MANKTLDTEVLATLHILSKDTIKGIYFMEFTQLRGSIMYLLEKDYIKRINDGPESSYYCLTQQGIEFRDKILRFASDNY